MPQTSRRVKLYTLPEHKLALRTQSFTVCGSKFMVILTGLLSSVHVYREEGNSSKSIVWGHLTTRDLHTPMDACSFSHVENVALNTKEKVCSA